MLWPYLVTTTVCLVKEMMAARILGVFPTPSLSHQVVFRALTLDLARRGHELVVLTTDPAHLHTNITEIDMHDVSYALWDELFMTKIFEAERNGQRSLLNQYRLYYTEVSIKMFNAQVTLPKIQNLIKNENFDLILVECWARPFHAIRLKIKAPLILVSSLAASGFAYDAIGVPTHPLYYPGILSTRTANLTLGKQVEAFFDYFCKLYYDAIALEIINNVLRRIFGKDTPNLADHEAQTDKLFVNVNPIWNGIRPTTANVLYTWGIHRQPAMELPLDLKRLLDNSTHGVVYMSLGSNMKSTALSADRLSVFLETFRRLPYDVLWKWEADELPGRSDNVYIAKWLPQADLLRHPNVKAFITQGGLQSTDEALSAGVPLVGIPFYGDQETNVERYKTHGVGVALSINTLTTDQLEDAVKSVAQEEKYRAAVQSMARLLADEGVAGGVQRASWWVEYVIRHGGAQHLRSPAAGVSASEYFMLDVAAVLVFAISSGLFITLAAVYHVFSFFSKNKIIK